MMEKAKISRAGFARFFERNQNAGTLSNMAAIFSTHPPDQTRIDLIKQSAAKDQASVPILSDAKWLALKEPCKPILRKN